MRSIAAVFTLTLPLAVAAVPAAAQSRTDLSGRWLSGGRVLTIAASDAAFRVDTGRSTTELRVATRTPLAPSGSALANWDGNAMVVELSRGGRTMTRRFELTGPNTMRVTSTRLGRTRTTVYSRQ